MQRFSALAVCVGVGTTLALAAQQLPDQEPFRAGVDVIEIDVSVLDEDRRPVRGLEEADFEVFEDGTPQRIVSFAHVELAEADPVRSARMRFATPDIAINNLADRLEGGRLFAIVLDDMNLPADDADIVIATREAARRVVEQLGPSDQAAVVYVNDAGNTQDYTSDQRALYEAIDRFLPRPPDWIGPTPQGPGPGGGDMPQRFSPVLTRSPCLRAQPAVPTLEAVTASLAGIPGRRKTVIFLSVGLPVTFSSRDTCGAQRDAIMRDVFRTAQRANVNIYAVDPAGYNGYRNYVDLYRARGAARFPGSWRRPTNLGMLRDFMKTLAENTGGRSIIDTDAVLPEIDRIFEEDAAYYLIGYESSHGEPDGEFRTIEVDVRLSGVDVRHRSGYWAPDAESAVARDRDGAPEFEPAMSGLTGPPGVPLRATAAAVGPAGEEAADVVVALSVGWPELLAPVTETLTIVRNVYDEDGRTGDPVQEMVPIELNPGEEVRYDMLRHLSLPPGRHQIRYNVRSALLDRDGTVYVDVVVPAFSRSALSLSGVMLGTPVADAGETPDAPLPLDLPVRPTTARDFANGELIDVFFRLHQGGTSELTAATVRIEVFDAGDESHFDETTVLEPAAFGADRGAPVRVTLPLDQLAAGPHLLSLSARLPSGRTARREVLFRVR